MLTSLQQEYLRYAAYGVAGIVIYWYIWRQNARAANIIVFLLALLTFAYALDWNYLLNTYFRVNWKLP